MAREKVHVQVTLGISGDAESDPLAVVRGITRGTRSLEPTLREAVRTARRRGHSWNQIAEALGVTRQAAWERFRSEDEDPVSAAIGALAGPGPTSEEMRAAYRAEEEDAERRRSGTES